MLARRKLGREHLAGLIGSETGLGADTLGAKRGEAQPREPEPRAAEKFWCARRRRDEIGFENRLVEKECFLGVAGEVEVGRDASYGA